MIQVRKSDERGAVDFGWLQSKHSFSFGHYHDPQHMGFRSLRVINEDRVAGGMGFDPHPHRDMEIISYVVDGALEHKDSMGNGEVIRPGEVQVMTAGTGVVHSEYNPDPARPVHFLQMWVLPARRGLAPNYGQRLFAREEKLNRLALVAAPATASDRTGALPINQDVTLYAGIVEPGVTIAHDLDPTRHAWVQVVRGPVTVNGTTLQPGDGAALSRESTLTLEAAEAEAEVLVYDLG